MKSLNTLFEEDIEMQDAIEDMDSLAGDDEDILIGVIEDRFKTESSDVHLFTNEDYNILREEMQLSEDVEELLDDKYDDIHLSDDDLDELFDDDLEDI